jgi:hypothetical protein
MIVKDNVVTQSMINSTSRAPARGVANAHGSRRLVHASQALAAADARSPSRRRSPPSRMQHAAQRVRSDAAPRTGLASGGCVRRCAPVSATTFATAVAHDRFARQGIRASPRGPR